VLWIIVLPRATAFYRTPHGNGIGIGIGSGSGRGLGRGIGIGRHGGKGNGRGSGRTMTIGGRQTAGGHGKIGGLIGTCNVRAVTAARTNAFISIPPYGGGSSAANQEGGNAGRNLTSGSDRIRRTQP
jgi:hypothetical protein